MAIGDTVQAGLLKADFSPIERGGAAKGRAYRAIGQGINSAIEKYQLNKEKREAEERTAMGNLAGFSPEELMEMKGRDPNLSKAIDNIQSGNASPKDFQLINASSAPYIAGRSRRLQEENAQIKNQIDSLNLELGRLLKDPKVRTAVAEASTAESNAVTADAKASYANSIASAEYSEKIADGDLKRAQAAYYEAKAKAEEKTDSYKPGQRVDIEGASGNKVSFVWTGNSLQPLNDSVSKKSIDEAIIRGVDPAAMKVYLEDNYDYNEDTELYTFKGKSNMVGYGGGQKDPMMERAITILGMRGQVKDEDLPSDSSKEESAKIEPTIDEHKSANEKAKSSGKMFYIINGEKYKVQ